MTTDTTLTPAIATVSAAGAVSQQEVYALVVERGYHAGYSEDQFAARQIVKLGEELAELATAFKLPEPMAVMLRALGNQARHVFDCGAWKGARLDQHHAERVLVELADLQVVLFVLAESISRVSGLEFNLLAAAMQKAASDVERGTRVFQPRTALPDDSADAA